MEKNNFIGIEMNFLNLSINQRIVEFINGAEMNFPAAFCRLGARS